MNINRTTSATHDIKLQLLEQSASTLSSSRVDLFSTLLAASKSTAGSYEREALTPTVKDVPSTKDDGGPNIKESGRDDEREIQEEDSPADAVRGDGSGDDEYHKPIICRFPGRGEGDGGEGSTIQVTDEGDVSGGVVTEEGDVVRLPLDRDSEPETGATQDSSDGESNRFTKEVVSRRLRSYDYHNPKAIGADQPVHDDVFVVDVEESATVGVTTAVAATTVVEDGEVQVGEGEVESLQVGSDAKRQVATNAEAPTDERVSRERLEPTRSESQKSTEKESTVETLDDVASDQEGDGESSDDAESRNDRHENRFEKSNGYGEAKGKGNSLTARSTNEAIDGLATASVDAKTSTTTSVQVETSQAVTTPATANPQAAAASVNTAAVDGTTSSSNGSSVSASSAAGTTESRSESSAAKAAESGKSESATQLNRMQQRRLVQRVSQAIRTAQKRDGEIRLRLSPPELGSMRLEVRMQDRTMVARLQTETEAARQVISENLSVLRDRLAEQGIVIESFEIDVQSEDTTQGNGSSFADEQTQQSLEQDQRSNSKSTQIDTASGSTTTDEVSSPTAIVETGLSSSGLNVVV